VIDRRGAEEDGEDKNLLSHQPQLKPGLDQNGCSFFCGYIIEFKAYHRWTQNWFNLDLVIALRPKTPKHVRYGWSHYFDTSEPVGGNGDQNMVTVHSVFRTSDLSITCPTRLPTALTGPTGHRRTRCFTLGGSSSGGVSPHWMLTMM
jgi:hypothetical protein